MRPTDFTVAAWRSHLNSHVLPYIEKKVDADGQPQKPKFNSDGTAQEPRAEHVRRARFLLIDRSMNRQWARLAAHANDAKPFPRGALGPPDWRRCLTEFVTSLVYGFAERPPAKRDELDAIVAAITQLRAQVRLHPDVAFLAERRLRAQTRGEHCNYLRLNDSTLTKAIDHLNESMLPGGPRTSFKGSRKDVNAIAFYMKYHVVAQWFDGEHDEAIARGIRVVRADLKNAAYVTAGNVRALLPVSTTEPM